VAVGDGPPLPGGVVLGTLDLSRNRLGFLGDPGFCRGFARVDGCDYGFLLAGCGPNRRTISPDPAVPLAEHNDPAFAGSLGRDGGATTPRKPAAPQRGRPWSAIRTWPGISENHQRPTQLLPLRPPVPAPAKAGARVKTTVEPRTIPSTIEPCAPHGAFGACGGRKHMTETPVDRLSYRGRITSAPYG
jgi:hypothetical protein